MLFGYTYIQVISSAKSIYNHPSIELPPHEDLTLQGFPLTYLRVPVNLIADGFNEADFTARGNADGSQECNGSKSITCVYLHAPAHVIYTYLHNIHVLPYPLTYSFKFALLQMHHLRVHNTAPHLPIYPSTQLSAYLPARHLGPWGLPNLPDLLDYCRIIRQ